MMFRNAKVWSQHDLPGLNPACFFLSSASTWCFPLSKTAYEKNILLVDNGLIPRQLFYSVLSPISGNSSFFHSGHHFIESLIPPALDASSALQALTSLLFRLSRLSLFYLNFLRPCTFLIALNLSFIMASKNM